MSQSTATIFTSSGPGAALRDLSTDLVDAVRGYEEMLEDAEDDLKPVVQRLRDLHSEHAAQIFNLLAEKGEEPNTSGSMMGEVHAAVVKARSWFGGLDTSALEAITDGERRLLDSYDKAARRLGADEETALATVDAQRKELRNYVASLDTGGAA